MFQRNILRLIEKNIKILDISLSDDSWRKIIPSKPGWYFIETNTPPDVLRKLGPPKWEHHYNIPAKVEVSLSIKSFGVCIQPKEDSYYIVYSGEAKNLKARVKEHVSGHPKTYCLALTNYPALHRYAWRIHFTPCPTVDNPNGSKLMRIIGEQIWRSKYGWPILCGK